MGACRSPGHRARGAAGNVTSAYGRRSGPSRPRATGPRSHRGPAADCRRAPATLIERILTGLGWNASQAGSITEDELQLLRYAAAVLAAGLPLVARLQLVRVYGQAMVQVADAEVRLFHLYVHEPLMRVATAFGDLAGYTRLTEERASCRPWTRSSASSSRSR